MSKCVRKLCTLHLIIFSLLCITPRVNASLKLTEEVDKLKPDQVTLLECTVHVIQEYSSVFRKVILINHYEPLFIPNDPSDVENTTEYIFSHSDLLARLGRPILIMSSDKLTALQGFFVVFTDRLDEEFTDMFSLIHMTKDNRFLVVVLGEHRDNVQDLFRLFYQFLRLHIINVVVLMKRLDSTYAYYCHPFSTNVTVADVWLADRKQFKKGLDLYDDFSKTRDMHGFKLKCLVKNKPPDTVVLRRNNRWEYDGLGVNLLLEVSKIMNFTPDIMFPEPELPLYVDRFGYDISPFMDHVIIGALTLREVDLAFGVFSHLLYVSPTTDLSAAAAEECFTFAVPSDAGLPPPIWSDFINEFRPAVWFCLACTFITNVAIWYIASKWQSYKSSFLLSNTVEERQPSTVDKVHGRPKLENDNGLTSSSGRRTYREHFPMSYRNPLFILKNCLQTLKLKIPWSIFPMISSTKVVDERAVFKKSYRKKLAKLLSDAQDILARQTVKVASETQNAPKKYRNVSLVEVLFLEIALTLGTPNLNKVGNEWLMRFLFMQYVFFCLITSQAYLGSLGSFMTYPNERGQIRTPEELYDRNLKLMGVPQSKLILGRALSKREILRKLSERWVSYEGHFEKLLLMIHKDRNISTFGTSRFLQFYITNNPGLKNNSDSIFIFPQCTVHSYSSPFLFQRGSPLIAPVNKILFRITESGLTRKWYDTATPRKLIVTRDPVQRLDMGQVQGCFVMLMVLHSISLMMFVGELIMHVQLCTKEVQKGT